MGPPKPPGQEEPAGHGGRLAQHGATGGSDLCYPRTGSGPTAQLGGRWQEERAAEWVCTHKSSSGGGVQGESSYSLL